MKSILSSIHGLGEAAWSTQEVNFGRARADLTAPGPSLDATHRPAASAAKFWGVLVLVVNAMNVIGCRADG